MDFTGTTDRADRLRAGLIDRRTLLLYMAPVTSAIERLYPGTAPDSGFAKTEQLKIIPSDAGSPKMALALIRVKILQLSDTVLVVDAPLLAEALCLSAGEIPHRWDDEMNLCLERMLVPGSWGKRPFFLHCEAVPVDLELLAASAVKRSRGLKALARFLAEDGPDRMQRALDLPGLVFFELASQALDKMSDLWDGPMDGLTVYARGEESGGWLSWGELRKRLQAGLPPFFP